jgi:hypothetical protein
MLWTWGWRSLLRVLDGECFRLAAGIDDKELSLTLREVFDNTSLLGTELGERKRESVAHFVHVEHEWSVGPRRSGHPPRRGR